MVEGQKPVNGDLNGLHPPRGFDEQGHPIPEAFEWRRAHVAELNRSLDDLAKITDETDTDELWDEVLRNLGVDPATGGPLEP
jgi:hypothetical protein